MSDCSCESKNTPLVFTCSGAADVGEVADQAARALHKNGLAQMCCLAGIGGKLDFFMGLARSHELIVIDGCPMNCAQATLIKAGFNHFTHIELANLGLNKGETNISAGEGIEKVITAVADCLG